ncbi:MAG: CHASE2 domain-containing protein [Burkholderiales bacterium]
MRVKELTGAFELRGRFYRLVNSYWVAIGAALLGLAITQTHAWRQVELRLLDTLVVRTAPNQVDLPITIIGVDESTLEALGTTWPLPRRFHAQLLDRLREADVAAVGFDSLFSDLTQTKDDEAFAAAIKRFPNVVLASDLVARETAVARQWARVDPHPMFIKAGALQGYSNMELDNDAVLRHVPVVLDSFWRALLWKFDQARPGVVESLDATEDMLIRYLGGPHTFNYIPFQYILQPEGNLPLDWQESLKDHIVLVGRKLNVIGEVGAAQGEVYQTPFYQRTREFMPRVEAHANLVASIVSKQVLREAPEGWPIGAWFSAVFIAIAFMRRWHPLHSGIVLALLIAALAALQIGFFLQYGVWIATAGAAMTITLIFVAQGAVAFIAEQRQRGAIKNAFSMYVSPALVEQVLANPDKLKLGGERRQVTILFSDLAGFTTISEAHPPEKVAGLINVHLSAMTEEILAHQGTVEKFVGDGIMAMWGAPVDDDKQAENAVRASIVMQQRWEALRPQIIAEVGTFPRMRIGINCGSCILGNMGGNNRFDYTAVGDPVNLASRIEGVNKVYGTPTLASGDVVDAVAGAMRFREVDTVIVKGKVTGIRMLTPCDDEVLIGLSDSALAAWREGRLGDARRGWETLLASYPFDPVAKVFLERIEALGSDSAPEGWDGMTKLDEK